VRSKARRGKGREMRSCEERSKTQKGIVSVSAHTTDNLSSRACMW
jgi:hypothetical protein